MSLYDDCICKELENSWQFCEKHFWSLLLHKEDDTVPACITQSSVLSMVFDTTTP